MPLLLIFICFIDDLNHLDVYQTVTIITSTAPLTTMTTVNVYIFLVEYFLCWISLSFDNAAFDRACNIGTLIIAVD